MCYGKIASRFLFLCVMLGMSLTLQAKGVYETDAERQNEQPNDAPVKIHSSDENTSCGFTWVGAGNGNIPPGAVVGGHTSKGENLYIARAYHGDDLLPGKILPSHKQVYVSYAGKEYSYKNYEVLVEARRGFRVRAEDAGNE